MFYNPGQLNTVNVGKIKSNQANGKWKLMLVIDNINESEKLLGWLNNFNKPTNYSWIVIFAESDLSDSYLSRLNEKFKIAEKMNAEKIFCYRTNKVSTLLKIAEANNTTHIISSKSIKRRLLLPVLVKNKVKRLKTNDEEIDIFSLNGDNAPKPAKFSIFGNN
jgi:K+-sensing histidine kinase KdpD